MSWSYGSTLNNLRVGTILTVVSNAPSSGHVDVGIGPPTKGVIDGAFAVMLLSQYEFHILYNSSIFLSQFSQTDSCNQNMTTLR